MGDGGRARQAGRLGASGRCSTVHRTSDVAVAASDGRLPGSGSSGPNRRPIAYLTTGCGRWCATSPTSSGAPSSSTTSVISPWPTSRTSWSAARAPSRPTSHVLGRTSPSATQPTPKVVTMPEIPNDHDDQNAEQIDRVLRDAGARMRAATATAIPPAVEPVGSTPSPAPVDRAGRDRDRGRGGRRGRGVDRRPGYRDGARSPRRHRSRLDARLRRRFGASRGPDRYERANADGTGRDDSRCHHSVIPTSCPSP